MKRFAFVVLGIILISLPACNKEIKIDLGNETQIERIQLGGIEIPDVNSNNNYYVIQK